MIDAAVDTTHGADFAAAFGTPTDICVLEPVRIAAPACRPPARLAGLLLAGCVAVPALAQGDGPPVAPVRNVTDTYFGTKVDDPYRYFEQTDNREVQRWMKAQDGHTRAQLARIPGRQALIDTLERMDASVPARVTQVQRLPGELYLMLRREVADDQFKLVVREGLGGDDRVLVDPQQIAKRSGKPHAINWVVPSPDGKLVAYGISAQGSEAAVMHVVDVRSGRAQIDPVTRTDYGGVSWSPDGRSLVFNRLQPFGKDAPPTMKYQYSQVRLLRLGEKVDQAVPVFGTMVGRLPIRSAEVPVVELTEDGRWAIGKVFNGTQREIGLFVSPQGDLLAGRPKWRRLVAPADAVTGVTYIDDTLYLVTHKGTPRGLVAALSLKSGKRAARIVVPPSDHVVLNAVAASDALYIEVRDGNIKRLLKRAHAPDAATTEVTLPYDGGFELAGEGIAAVAHPKLPGVVFELQGWNRSRQVYAVAPDGTVANTGLQPRGPLDRTPDIVSTEVKVPSHDGAQVPMTVLHHRDVRLDGENPTLLYGYAAYGITEEPYFSHGFQAWLQQGGVLAVANPRGSGVYGQDWYKAGFQASKPNTWKDFIACAEHLIAQGYTRPAKLGIFGGSAGGILVGRAMTERPDLFGAVVSAVGALDAVRFETTANGVPNIPEFGSVKKESGFRALLAMSTYHHIAPATAYPAVLFTHGVNDPRVEVWQSSKTAARLMAATNSGKPVLLRLDFDAGHGVGNTKRQQIEERADIYSFLLWQLGAPGFQP